MNGTLSGWENTRANLPPRFRPAGDPVAAAAPPRAGVRTVSARTGSEFGTRVDSAGKCEAVSRGERTTYVCLPRVPQRLGVTRGFLQVLWLPQPGNCLGSDRQKDFGPPTPRSQCLRCCGLGSSSLAPAAPWPPWQQRSVTAPGLASVLHCAFLAVPAAQGGCRRNATLDRETAPPTAPPRQRGGQTGARRRVGRGGGGGVAPQAAPAVWRTERGASLAPGCRGGARQRERSRARPPHHASAAADLPGGARLQHLWRAAAEGAACRARGRKADTSEDTLPELLAPLEKLSSFRTGSLNMRLHEARAAGGSSQRIPQHAAGAVAYRDSRAAAGAAPSARASDSRVVVGGPALGRTQPRCHPRLPGHPCLGAQLYTADTELSSAAGSCVTSKDAHLPEATNHCLAFPVAFAFLSHGHKRIT